MDLTSSQHRHASSLWASLTPPGGGKGADNIASSKIAFVVLGLLNIPAPAAYHFIKYRATRHAIAEWPETFNARWIASFWPDKKPSLLAEHVSAEEEPLVDAGDGELHALQIQPSAWEHAGS